MNRNSNQEVVMVPEHVISTDTPLHDAQSGHDHGVSVNHLDGCQQQDSDSDTLAVMTAPDGLLDTHLQDLLHSEGTVGTPHLDAQHFSHASTDFTCVPAIEIGIVNEYLGTHYSEAEATYEATQNHTLSHLGTERQHVGMLLTHYGIENHHVENAAVSDLVAELSLGHKVIVGVSADELRDPEHPLHDFTQQADGHAIWVTGFDGSDVAHPRVIINDSANQEGAGVSYPLDTFLKAWHSDGFQYVSTDHAPPNLADRAEGFDAASGTFPEIAADVRAHDPTFLVDEEVPTVELLAEPFEVIESLEEPAPPAELIQHWK